MKEEKKIPDLFENLFNEDEKDEKEENINE
jgi:hypothetical protein